MAQATKISAAALLAWRQQQLVQGGAGAELDWLLEMAGGLDWPQRQRLRLDPSRKVALSSSLEEIEQLWKQHRQTQTPLQYLVGLCPWRDLELRVGPGVLIPRQETELLVDLALQQRPTTTPLQGLWRWADLGTGSGCLALALALAWPDSEGHAVDCSPEALAQAKTNLEAAPLQKPVMLHLGSWWEPLRAEWGQLNLVVANPPYIPEAVWQELEPVVRDHEPALALKSGADGLDALRAIVAGAKPALAPGGWLLLEHHHDQSAQVLELLEQHGLEHCQAWGDLEGRLRFAGGRRAR